VIAAVWLLRHLAIDILDALPQVGDVEQLRLN
jgi:hypothetical protein